MLISATPYLLAMQSPPAPLTVWLELKQRKPMRVKLPAAVASELPQRKGILK